MINYLVDSHCHLNMLKEEKNFPINDVIARAEENMVKIINNISTNINEFDKVLNVAKNHKNVYATIGVHPSEIDLNIKNQELLDLLLKYSKEEKVIAYGETGFEYFCEPITDKKIQKNNLEVHIEACRKTGLPLVIHTRDADEDMIEVLTSEMKNGEFKFLLHCFSSGKKLCWTGLDLGGYVSLSGIITFKKADELRDIVKDIPLNRIMLETDSPFLAPIPYRGKTNEPAYVKNIAEYLSNFLTVDFNQIQEITTKNFITLFNKVKGEI